MFFQNSCFNNTFSLSSHIRKALNGRFYGGRTISAETYDGVTKFEIQETEEELQKRLDDWEKFIGGDDDDDNSNENDVGKNTTWRQI